MPAGYSTGQELALQLWFISNYIHGRTCFSEWMSFGFWVLSVEFFGRLAVGF